MKFHEQVLAETRDISWRDRLHLPSGKTRLAENVLKTDVLIFEPGSDLEIGKVDASYVTIIAKNIHIQDGNVMSRIKVVREEGIDGANGADGENGLRHGANGKSGKAGTAGSHPSTPPRLVIICNSLTYGAKPNSGNAPLVIDSAGGRGAVGGDGGEGGDGHVGSGASKGLWSDGDIPP